MTSQLKQRQESFNKLKQQVLEVIESLGGEVVGDSQEEEESVIGIEIVQFLDTVANWRIDVGTSHLDYKSRKEIVVRARHLQTVLRRLVSNDKRSAAYINQVEALKNNLNKVKQ